MKPPPSASRKARKDGRNKNEVESTLETVSLDVDASGEDHASRWW